MARRLFLLAVSIFLLFLLSACGGQAQAPAGSQPPVRGTGSPTVWGAEVGEARLQGILADGPGD